MGVADAALARDLALALDPAEVLRRMVGAPDEWQRRLLRSTAPQILVNVCRQAGKTTSVGALGAHVARYRPGSLTLCTSATQRQAVEYHRAAKAGLRALGVTGAELEADNVLTTELATGSRVIALPAVEATVRGYAAASLLVIDEAARVPDEVYRALRPSLAIGRGQLIAMSTPYGRRGWWWDAWEHGGDSWERYEIRAEQCARLRPEFLVEERRAWGIFYAQEYECQFLDATTALFSGADIDAMLDHSVEPLFPVAPWKESA